MKIKIHREILVNAVQAVQNIINPKSALPILANILVTAEANKIRLTATDLDIGISCELPVDIIEPGAVSIPAKRFSDIIKELPGENVSVMTKKNNMVIIETDSCQFKIMGAGGEEFPKLPEFKNKEVIELEQGDLKEMLRLVSFAASVDETRYVLNGVMFKIEKNELVIVATDGKRLAINLKKLPAIINQEIHFIVPIKTIHELGRNLKEDGICSLIVSGNQALFDLGYLVIISRLIEGEFPNYQQVVPPASENKISVDREQFLLAVRRAALLSTPDYQPVKFEVFKNKLVISKTTPDIGESREELAVEYQGKEVVVGFNPAYLIDVLKNLPTQRVELELSGNDNRGVIRQDGYIYIIMPMLLG